MDGRCESCKHWTPRAYKSAYESEIPEGGNCTCEKFMYTEETELKRPGNDCLVYWDYEGYSAGFETGKDFGCVHWEAKQ